jgi:hypothetical protein
MSNPDVWQPMQRKSNFGLDVARHPYPGLGKANPLLTSEQIKTQISGRDVSLEVTDLGALQVRFEPDGKIYRRSGQFTEVGHWNVVKSRLCIDTNRSPKLRCYQIAKNGPLLMFFILSGAPAGRASFENEGG